MRRFFRTLLFIVAAVCLVAGGIFLFTETQRPVDFSASDKVVDSNLVTSAATQLAQENGVRQVIDRMSEDKRFGPTAMRCIDVRLGTRSVGQLGDDEYLVPASGMKLLTAHAVLRDLKNASRPSTSLNGTVANGGVSRLAIVGGGDPFLMTDEFASKLKSKKGTSSLDELVDKLKGLGVTHVSGNISVDDSLFDTQRRIADWPTSYGPTVVAPIGALTVNENRANSTAPATNADPGLFAGEQFKSLLQKSGITVTGAVVRSKSTAPKLAILRSANLEDQIALMLRESNNASAEMYTKLLSSTQTTAGTTSAGLIAARKTYEDLSTGPNFVQADGSGLSASNKVRCSTLLLAYQMLPQRVKSQLSIAGESGTLSDRLVGTYAAHNLQAKTGTLNQASSLTGKVQTRGGALLDFSAIANGMSGEAASRLWQDALGTALAEVR